jgi:hypothetical protein
MVHEGSELDARVAEDVWIRGAALFDLIDGVAHDTVPVLIRQGDHIERHPGLQAARVRVRREVLNHNQIKKLKNMLLPVN